MTLMSLLPLRCTVQNASAGLETPQRVTEQVVHAHCCVMALTGESREADGFVLGGFWQYYTLAFAFFISHCIGYKVSSANFPLLPLQP